jgi:hypothetical protein
MSINASNGKDSSLNWKVFITPGISITTDTTKTARELYEQMLNLYPDDANPHVLWLGARAAKGEGPVYE